MAISIKNHEDRITALENKSINLDKRQVVLWSGSDAGVKKFKLSESADNFDVIGVTFKNWRIAVIPKINFDIITLDFIRSNLSVLLDIKDRMYLNVSYNETSQPLTRVIGLKLYYNFSYNITREFYKVKFKLKHYLCSHLQKFI